MAFLNLTFLQYWVVNQMIFIKFFFPANCKMAFIKGIQGCWLTWRSTCLASKQQTRKQNVWLDFSLALQQPWRTGLRRFISFHMHTSHWGSGNEKTRCSILADAPAIITAAKREILCLSPMHYFSSLFSLLLYLHSITKFVFPYHNKSDQNHKQKKKQPECSKLLLGLVYEIRG